MMELRTNLAPGESGQPSAPTTSLARWRALAFALWLIPLVVLAILIIARPGHRSVTPLYHKAVEAWWARQPIYDGPAGMNYLPHFTALFTPYHILGNRLGDILWRCTGLAGLVAGLWLFSGAITCPRPERWRAFALATLFMLPLSLPALQNGQANAQLSAALLLAGCCLHLRRWTGAVVFLWLTASIKPLGFAAIGLAWAAYPQLWWRLGLGLPVFLAFPFAFGPPGYVASQWLAAWDNLRQCSAVTQHRFADLNGLLRTFGMALAGGPSLAVRAGAGAALMVFCRFGAGGQPEPRRALLWLSAAAGFLMLFNPMTEANSYVVLAPALALMAWWELSRGTRRLGWLFAGMVLTMGVLPNLVRPFLGNYFALAWHPAMTILFLAIVAWQSRHPRSLATAEGSE